MKNAVWQVNLSMQLEAVHAAVIKKKQIIKREKIKHPPLSVLTHKQDVVSPLDCARKTIS